MSRPAHMQFFLWASLATSVFAAKLSDQEEHDIQIGFHDLLEARTSAPQIKRVGKITLPTKDEFLEYYALLGCPIIFHGLEKPPDLSWETVVSKFGSNSMRIRQPNGKFSPQPVGEYITNMLNEQPSGTSGKVTYAAGIKHSPLANWLGFGDASRLPPFLYYSAKGDSRTDTKHPSTADLIGQSNFWIGPVGSKTGLHKDSNDNFLYVAIGKKQIFLYPPEDHDKLKLYPLKLPLYVGKDGRKSLFRSSPVNPESPDYKKFPGLKQTNPLKVMLGPGEMLYIPAGWFHHIVNLEPCLSVNHWRYGKPMAMTHHASSFYGDAIDPSHSSKKGKIVQFDEGWTPRWELYISGLLASFLQDENASFLWGMAISIILGRLCAACFWRRYWNRSKSKEEAMLDQRLELDSSSESPSASRIASVVSEKNATPPPSPKATLRKSSRKKRSPAY